MRVQDEAVEVLPYFICPLNGAEASYGKATLLTDVMLAQVLDCLKDAKAPTIEGQEALGLLWRKFYDLWDEPCSESREPTA